MLVERDFPTIRCFGDVVGQPGMAQHSETGRRVRSGRVGRISGRCVYARSKVPLPDILGTDWIAPRRLSS